MLRDIENRADIEVVVNSFYAKVRNDAILGPIFNAIIEAERWPKHLARIADFWDFRIFNTACYDGKPLHNHLKVDAHMNYSLTTEHFMHWLGIWEKNIDAKFAGKNVELSKKVARSMATNMSATVFEMRPGASLAQPKMLHGLNLKIKKPSED